MDVGELLREDESPGEVRARPRWCGGSVSSAVAMDGQMALLDGMVHGAHVLVWCSRALISLISLQGAM